MKYYMAPLEGLTGRAYRNAYATYFHNVDKYFAPFISSNHENKMTTRERSDILPENNHEAVVLIPQILSCNAEDFLHTAEEIATYGYDEINLNLGCPSGTVTAKGKGSGFLLEPEKLDRFLDEIYRGSKVKISVKTRIGYHSAEEFEEILAIYNKYPIYELIIHPRTKKAMYGGTPDLEAFARAVEKSRHSLIYNGDICTVEDYRRIVDMFPDIDGVMLGRGLLKDPTLVGQILGEEGADAKTLRAFHDHIFGSYQKIMSGDRTVLYRMKEFWSYFGNYFGDETKLLKKIRKAEHYDRYLEAVDQLFEKETKFNKK